MTWVIADHSAAPGSKELTVTKGQQVEVLENGSNISGVNTSEWTHVRLLVAPGQVDPPPEGLVPTSALKQPPPVSSKTSPSRKVPGQQQQQQQQQQSHYHQQQSTSQIQTAASSGGITTVSSGATGIPGSSSSVVGTGIVASGGLSAQNVPPSSILPDETGERNISLDNSKRKKCMQTERLDSTVDSRLRKD